MLFFNIIVGWINGKNKDIIDPQQLNEITEKIVNSLHSIKDRHSKIESTHQVVNQEVISNAVKYLDSFKDEIVKKHKQQRNEEFKSVANQLYDLVSELERGIEKLLLMKTPNETIESSIEVKKEISDKKKSNEDHLEKEIEDNQDSIGKISKEIEELTREKRKVTKLWRKFIRISKLVGDECELSKEIEEILKKQKNKVELLQGSFLYKFTHRSNIDEVMDQIAKDNKAKGISVDIPSKIPSTELTCIRDVTGLLLFNSTVGITGGYLSLN